MGRPPEEHDAEVEKGPSQKAKTSQGGILPPYGAVGAALSAAKPRKTKPRVQNRSGQPASP